MAFNYTPSRSGLWISPTDQERVAEYLRYDDDTHWCWVDGVSISHVVRETSSWEENLSWRSGDSREWYFSSKSYLKLPAEMFTQMRGD